ncbi:MAG: hypothetical protein JWO44_1131 [Bacteroidetes bacterium]|nr:hypothetical protein [Bacteroidota bacterium]
MNKILTILFTCILFSAAAQDKTEKETALIVEEGKKLYRSEMASWYGTDIFLAKFASRRADIGGYFSYTDSTAAKCIFFSKGDHPKVIGTISFDSTYNVNTAIADGTEREFTPYEQDLCTIRQKAFDEIKSDEMFKSYEHMNFNLVPLIDGHEKKVYVFTGPEDNGYVIIGNDYLLTFDKKNKLLKKKSLHKNILSIPYGKDEEVVSMHTHLPETGDYITATDICTLMLYEKIASWKQHIVISEDYVCLWDCKTNQLVALTRKAWDNIYKDQKERHKQE